MATTVETLGEQDLARAGTPAQDRIATWLTLAWLAVALLVFVAAPVLALRWINQPFVGGFMEQTLVFNGVGRQSWPLLQAGVGFPEQLQRVNGVTVSSTRTAAVLLEGSSVGEPVRLQLRNLSSGQTREVEVTLQRFSLGDLLTYFIIPYVIGLGYLAIGLWVFYLRRHEMAGRAFALFCASVGLAVGTLFDLYTTHTFPVVWTVSLAMGGAALLTLSLVFPQEVDWLQRYPVLRWLGFAPGVWLAMRGGRAVFDFARPIAYADAWLLEYIFAGLAVLVYLGMTLYHRLTTTSPIAREQTRIILLGTLISFAPVLSYFAAILIQPGIPFNAALLLPTLVVFPLSVGYAILRYRLLDTDYVIGQGLVYAALGVLAAVGYWALVAGASLISGQLLPASNPFLLSLLVLLLVVLFNPVRLRLQRLVNQVFFRTSLAYRQQLQAFGRELTLAVDLGQIVALLRREIENTIQPEHLHIFLFESSSRSYGGYAGPGGSNGQGEGAATTDLRFSADSPLARHLADRRAALHFNPDSPIPSALMRERSRLAVLGSEVLVGLPGKAALSGWLALGHKLSGEPYTSESLGFLESLADQAALAVERVQVISDLERRVEELNVLSRLAQAVNFTIGYDDLLELLYAQTSKLMDTRNFRIVLREGEESGQTGHYYAFYVEGNERLTERERRPLPSGQGLTAETLRTGQPIRTDAYVEECRRRGVPPLDDRCHAWMGVPLNAGDLTLGVVALASFEAGSTFTEEQFKILQAIADQAAGAITKAQLYRETDERARQLATLNMVSQSLASTLELDPLLGRILDSAADILAVEAGSLLLTDQDTGDLIFRVTVGPVAADLVGQRLKSGAGFAGEAAATGRSLIVNDVQRDPRWYGGSDQQTGFVTRALMAAPLIIKDRLIGAIEVINKRDGTHFTEHDQALLTAFASQAAVAIENARLYTLTDQALAERVEELSVLQRIARELNVSLDLARTMDITLDWAMQSTHAQAGVVGRVVEGGLLLVAARGCDPLLEQYRQEPMPLNTRLLRQLIEDGESSLLPEITAESGQPMLRPFALSQLATPIRRESRTLGVIIVENDQPYTFDKEHLSFLTRLANQASIAITNATLYAEVNAANIAKSEFVSFVSHELKTPMTSIKGYADLLAQGAVGPVSEMQGNFLNTIRTNVERMSSLVSDLADISRIEAGHMRLEFASIPYDAAVADVAASSKAALDAKGQSLQVYVQPDLPPVWADQVRQVQILTNLVSNAHKYSPEGSVITVRVTLEANRRDPLGAPQVLHVLVQDQGIGISPQDQKSIFQKFFRSEDRAARESPGTGLGLNITKNLVELQGGRIWFESELRKGSTFHYTVPVAQEGAQPAAGDPG
ncbi:MAG: GAF domain-containing protein [Chloroflexi bacterium]|nr:GAF domain-containing protein [Chloroflexota bacterium]